MRVMVLVKANRESEDGVLPNEQQLMDMTQFNEELVEKGIMLAGEGLHPSSKGARVVFDHGMTHVIDGPFAETNELVAGFWIWQVPSLEEAIELAKRIPGTAIVPTGSAGTPVDESPGVIEIRPIFESEDFGESLTPELRRREDQMRAQVESQQ